MLSKRPKHIFIVEDNELYSMMLGYILSKDSIYQFVRFKSGEECIKNLYLNPDIIILDFGLPGINGFETLKEIKRHNEAIHVIMLSNNTDIGLAVRLLKAGARDYVLKQGYKETQIIEKIEDILKSSDHKINIPESSSGGYFTAKVWYFILIVVLVTLGFFSYN